MIKDSFRRKLSLIVFTAFRNLQHTRRKKIVERGNKSVAQATHSIVAKLKALLLSLHPIMQDDIQKMEDHQFCFASLGSGSTGNCYYLGKKKYGVLIDSGIGAAFILKRMQSVCIDIQTIQGIILTHEHFDHAVSAITLSRMFHIPIYATKKVMIEVRASRRKIKKHKYFTRESAFFEIEKGVPFDIQDINITGFDVPHDSVDNNGFTFRFGDNVLTVVTDAGIITDEMAEYMRQSNHLIIESNYDENMLNFGTYRAYLKDRVSSNSGHLSNRQTASFLAENYHENMRNIYLCHVSDGNNTPRIAYDTTFKAMTEKGIEIGKDVNLCVLKRKTPSGITFF